MKGHEKTIHGQITKDGKVALYMDELRDFARQWKGAKIIATFKVYQPGTSAAMRGYYYNYIVPAVRQALADIGQRMTQEQTEIYLRRLYPLMYNEQWDDNGNYTQSLREIKDLDNFEMSCYIDFLKEFADEDLHVYIKDSDEL